MHYHSNAARLRIFLSYSNERKASDLFALLYKLSEQFKIKNKSAAVQIFTFMWYFLLFSFFIYKLICTSKNGMSVRKVPLSGKF